MKQFFSKLTFIKLYILSTLCVSLLFANCGKKNKNESGKKRVTITQEELKKVIDGIKIFFNTTTHLFITDGLPYSKSGENKKLVLKDEVEKAIKSFSNSFISFCDSLEFKLVKDKTLEELQQDLDTNYQAKIKQAKNKIKNTQMQAYWVAFMKDEQITSLLINFIATNDNALLNKLTNKILSTNYKDLFKSQAIE